MRLAAGDDVLDVRLPDAGEIGAGVRPVDAAALLGDDAGLDALRIRIVVRVIVRAAVFRPVVMPSRLPLPPPWLAVGRGTGVLVGGTGVAVGGTGMLFETGTADQATLRFRSGA